MVSSRCTVLILLQEAMYTRRETLGFDAVHPLESTEQLSRSGAFAEKWGFLVKMIPCLPQHVVPDLYTQAEKRVDRVDEVISRLPLVDNGAAAEDGAITLQACSWIFFRHALHRKPRRSLRGIPSGEGSAFGCLKCFQYRRNRDCYHFG